MMLLLKALICPPAQPMCLRLSLLQWLAVCYKNPFCRHLILLDISLVLMAPAEHALMPYQLRTSALVIGAAGSQKAGS